jgi:hypothetical protein
MPNGPFVSAGEASLMDVMARVAALHAAVREINKHLTWIDDKLYEQARQDRGPTPMSTFSGTPSGETE